VGDEIEVGLRLVSAAAPHEEAIERRQWWFYPPGSTEDITAPREPFEAIKIYGGRP
jgi:hypothetical protein